MELTKEFIADKIKTDDAWMLRGMMAIYERQTSDEQRQGETKYQNKMGFSGCDAELLTSFCHQLIAGRALSERQRFYARKKMVKYAGQLLIVAKEKAAQNAK